MWTIVECVQKIYILFNYYYSYYISLLRIFLNNSMYLGSVLGLVKEITGVPPTVDGKKFI